MSAPAKNIIESSRDIVQDFLVPELKAVEVSIYSVEHEISSLKDSLSRQMESLLVEMKLRHENLEQLIRSGDERNEQLIRSLADKFDAAVEVRERLATLEALLPRH